MQYTPEQLKKILDDHTAWYETRFSTAARGARANLYGANLYGANLYGANLYGANLYGANLTRANLYGADLYGANLYGANLYGANLYGANLTRANLTRANLTRANLTRANLYSADFSNIYKDFMEKLSLQKEEVVGLFKAVLDGRIDGSTYEGSCACFVGTIANLKGVNYRTLTVRPHADSPTERLFLAISKGDTPENNRISEIVADWIIEFLMTNEMEVPFRTISWE